MWVGEVLTALLMNVCYNTECTRMTTIGSTDVYHFTCIVEIEPLRITQHPTDKTKHCRQGTILAVRASGGSGALAYRWVKDGEPFSEDSHPDCIGVYSDTLQFLSLAPVHSGTYVCRVSDEKANCIIESKPAVLSGMFLCSLPKVKDN